MNFLKAFLTRFCSTVCCRNSSPLNEGEPVFFHVSILVLLSHLLLFLFLTAIRKLTAKRGKVEGTLKRIDVLQKFSDYASDAYAPMTRIGVFPDRASEQYVVKSRHLNTYQGKTPSTHDKLISC